MSLRILVWNSWVTPAGGMERVAASIANGLVDHGHHVVLTGPFSEAPVVQRQIDPRVKFANVAFHRSALGVVKSALHLRRLVREEGIDVISAHGSLLPLLTLDTPVVWTEHGPRYGLEKILSGVRALPWRLVQRRLQAGRWHLVGCSEYVRKTVSEQLQLPPSAVSVIYNGVSRADELRGLPAPEFKPPYKIAVIGRLEPEKYPLDIFAMNDHLRAAGVPCEWHIFGDGSLMAHVRRSAAERGGGQVFVHGLSNTPGDAFKKVDVLAFLSHGEMEGLPTVLLEAQLARRPAVAWNVTCNPEAIGDRTWLVDPPFDLTRFAESIRDRLLSGIVPAEIPADQLSYDKMIDEYEAVLSRAASKTSLQADRYECLSETH